MIRLDVFSLHGARAAAILLLALGGHRAALADDKPGHPLPKGALARLGSPAWRNVASPNGFMRFAPDGRTVIVAHRDSLRAIDFETGRERWNAGGIGHDLSAADAPGDCIAVGSGDRIRIFDVMTGNEKPGIRLDLQQPSNIACNERYVVMHNSNVVPNGSAVVFDRASGKRLWTHGGDGSGYCYPLGFIPGSNYLVTRMFREGTSVAIIDVATKAIVRGWPLPKLSQRGYVNDAVLSPDGKLLWASGDNKVRLWDVTTGKEVASWSGHIDAVTVAAFFPDGKRLLTAGKDRSMRLWDIESGESLGKIDLERTAHKLAVSPDGERAVAVCAGESVLRRFDLTTLRGLPVEDGHTQLVEQTAWTPDGKHLLSASRDGTVRVWDVAARRTVRQWTPRTRSLNWLAISGDGTLTATAGYNDTPIEIWNIADGKRLHSMMNPEGSVGALVFAPRGTILATGTFHMTQQGPAIRLWDAATGRGVGDLPGHRRGIGQVSFHPDGKKLAATIGDNAHNFGDMPEMPTTIYDIATKRAVSFGGPIDHSAQFSPDGRTVAVVRQTRGVMEYVLHESASGQQRVKLDHVPGPRREGCFSPDGRFIVIQTSYGAVRGKRPPGAGVYDTASGKLVRQLETGGNVWCASVSPDSCTAATASEDGTILLWDLATVQPSDNAADINDKLWAHLASDAVTAYRAVVRLGRAGEHGAAFLRAKLKPAVPVDVKKLNTLFRDLGDERYAVWQKAAADLADLDCGEVILRERLKVATNAESRRVISKMLEGYDGWLTIPHELRRVRAVEAMERNGTPAARKLLQEWAAGDAASLLTREAKSALERKQP